MPRSTLSVVVPAYNVEDYLDECLVSILTQSYADLEVIVVDDGSTDSTAEVAARYAATDARVRLHRQDNVGLGATRNVGIELARGDLLAFADSDDVVFPGAYRALVDSLDASGSDLAIGSAHRLRGEKASMTPLMRENHQRRVSGVNVDERPLLLADCFAWNKVFRRSFWDRAALRFPVDVRYEDQPTITRALVEASRFDSLPDPVYGWRVRDDGSSISQQRGDVADLADRIRTKRWATSIVRQRTAPLTQFTWYARVLPVDLWEYFRCAPDASEEYWELLRGCLAEFWGPETVPLAQADLPARQRRMAELVVADRRDDLRDVIRSEHGDALTV
ncbi:glycosyltransferase family 2 protein [Nocardioides sp. CN2-186]|uniref:glycosyltransferase family 2 protein n=1 Tax=Nocardioides tweenelious TaxID=3156607 RepID=UPI0032B31EBF